MRQLVLIPLLGSSLALSGPSPAQEATAPVAIHVAGTVTVGPSQHQVTGSGRAVDDVRSVASFSAVRVTGPIDVVLRASDKEQVTVNFDDNLLPLIETRVDNDPGPSLTIRVQPGAAFKSRRAPRVTVEFKSISALALSGSGDTLVDGVRGPLFAISSSGRGDVRVQNLDVEVLGVSIAGSSDVVASGRAAEQGYSIAGSGDVNAFDLIGQTVKVRIAGSGDVQVHAEQMLDVSVAGSGDVVYRGSPVIRKSVAGSGEVRRAR